MQKALAHLREQNKNSRLLFHKVDANRSKAQEFRKLEDEYREAQDSAFQKKKEIQKLEMETEESTNRMGDNQEEIELLEERTERLMQVKDRVHNEKKKANVELAQCGPI